MATIAHRFGEMTENRVCDSLVQKGFSIRSRRYRIKGGEVDIIARRDNTIVFCEVKARKRVYDYDAVFSKKQLDRILLVSERYINDNADLASCYIRFDLFIFENFSWPA